MFHFSKTRSIQFILLNFIIACTALVSAQEIVQQRAQILPKAQVEYSAVNYMEIGDTVLNQKIYYTPDKERREMNLDGEEQLIIVRMDKKVSWMLVPEHKMYMEMNVLKGKIKIKDILAYYKIVTTSAEEDIVDGIKTIKSKVTISDPQGKKFEGFMWASMDNIVVKIDTVSVDEDSKGKIKMELKELKIEKQDPKLFDIPDDYVKTIILPGVGEPKLKKTQ